MLGDFDVEQYELRRSKSHPSCHPEWKPMNSSNPMPKKIKPENSTAAYFQGELTPKEGKIIFFLRNDTAVHNYTVQDLIHAQNADFVIRVLKKMVAKN